MTSIQNECPAVIVATNLGKTYHIYNSPQDRLKQMLVGKRRTYYRPFSALRNVSFTVNRGETLGIVGKNGSGKSTLLQLIAGILTPTTGDVTVSGRVAVLLELGAGFNHEFTGRENIYTNGKVLGLTRNEIDERFETIAQFADIGDFIDEPVKTYSSGMYIRLAFAVAINVSPDVLIIDEALAVGDEAFQRKCFAAIQAFKEGGGTLLFVSHSASAVIELCDRAICLDHGEMVFAGVPKQVVALYHQLIYAPAGESELIKSKIIKEHGHHLLSLSSSDPKDEQDLSIRSSLKSWYDPNLKPETTTKYQSLGVEISDPHLKCTDDQRVNILVNREDYEYTYQVHFSKDAFNVRFGMLIKTVSGFELGGAVTAPVSKGIEYVAKGTSFVVRFAFKCALSPGVYFLNAGVEGVLDGTLQYLARHIDVAMYRVQIDESRLNTSQVDFMIRPSFQIEHGVRHAT